MSLPKDTELSLVSVLCNPPFRFRRTASAKMFGSSSAAIAFPLHLELPQSTICSEALACGARATPRMHKVTSNSYILLTYIAHVLHNTRTRQNPLSEAEVYGKGCGLRDETYFTGPPCNMSTAGKVCTRMHTYTHAMSQRLLYSIRVAVTYEGVLIESVQWPGVFLRLDGKDVTKGDGSGGGVVNAQKGAGAWEVFTIKCSGAVATIESKEFTGFFN